MSNFISGIKKNRTRIVFGIFAIFSLAVLGLYATKHFGAQYAEKQIQEQLEHAGLLPFVHYDNLHFNPFTLTPSLEGVRFGHDSSPWLRFSRISFNSYPLTYPSLNVDFWLQESTPSDLANETAYWLYIAELDSLIGKGSFVSNVDGQNVTSQIEVDIKDVGTLSTNSEIHVLESETSMSELRTDFLASIALGQPEAVLIIHGNQVEVEDFEMTYQDQGLIKNWVFNKPSTPEEEYELYDTLRYSSETFGLAYIDSQEADHIANVMLNFLLSPNRLKMTMNPKKPINLSDLVLSVSNNNLYGFSNMTLTTP